LADSLHWDVIKLTLQVDSSPSPDKVYASVQKIMDKRLGTTSAASTSAPATASHATPAATPAHVESTPARTETLPNQQIPALGAIA
jgi:hypothetical protein